MDACRCKVVALLCLLYLGVLLGQQVAFVLGPVPEHPQVAAFFSDYARTTSIQIGVIVLCGAILAVLLWRRPTPGRALALACFCLFVFWRHYGRNLDVYLNPPFGDGTWATAVAKWWQVHAKMAWIHLPSFLFLAIAGCYLLFQAFAPKPAAPAVTQP